MGVRFYHWESGESQRDLLIVASNQTSSAVIGSGEEGREREHLFF